MTKAQDAQVGAALEVLSFLGLPRRQLNDRSALCLLALLDLRPDGVWEELSNPLMGITPIMSWAREHYGREYAPNSRESFRRQTMHQFVKAGIALLNPDKPDRPTNSPKSVYQIEPTLLTLLRAFGSEGWSVGLEGYLAENETLLAKYAKERLHYRVPVKIREGHVLELSPGMHNELIKAIVEDFSERFAPGSRLIYVGDTGEKFGYFDEELLASIGVTVDAHGKMPDVVLYFEEKNWLLLVESVTSHGPVNANRHAELSDLFSQATVGVVYVTAFPSRSVMGKYLGELSWETEVWVADSPSHMIHFNGSRFLGPYSRETP